MFVLSQITYGNMASIFLSHFHEYNKNEIHICRLLGYIESFYVLPHLVQRIGPYLLQKRRLFFLTFLPDLLMTT
jgi:hypothetical protein